MKYVNFKDSKRVKRLSKAIEEGLLLKGEAAVLLKMNRETFRLYYNNYKNQATKSEEIEELEVADLELEEEEF